MPDKLSNLFNALDWKDYLGITVLFVVVIAAFAPERLDSLLHAVERMFAAMASVIPGISL